MIDREGIRVGPDGVAVPAALVLASTSVRVGPAPCPLCHRPSRLTGVDGGPCLACALRSAAAQQIGESVYILATDNLQAAT